VNLTPFITYLISEKRSSAHTVEAYRSDLGQFEAWCARSFEVDDPSEITRPMVRSWLASLVEEKYSPASVHRKLSSLNAWFRFLSKSGVVASNPVKGLAKPKIPGRLPTFVEEKPAMRLYDLNAGKSEFAVIRNHLMVTLFYETGIRLSELIELGEKDIDSYLQQIKVTGKRNKVRLVPISGDLVREIERFRQFKKDGQMGDDVPFLLVSDRGKKLSRSFVYLTIKKYLSQVTTLKKRSPHVLRHTFATHLLNNGADLNVIKEILGHSSLAATQVYTHNSVEKLKKIHSGLHPRNKK